MEVAATFTVRASDRPLDEPLPYEKLLRYNTFPTARDVTNDWITGPPGNAIDGLCGSR
jgi:hypothetical protein